MIHVLSLKLYFKVLSILLISFCHSPLPLRQAFSEISTQQDVEERVDAAAGIAETDGEAIAHIESQRGLLCL